MPLDLSSSATGPAGIQLVDPLVVANWDSQLIALSGAGFFHSAAWARVLHGTYGYQPLYLTQYESGRLHAVLPLMEVASWLTGRRGVSLPFTDACEPLCPDASTFQRLFASAQDQAGSRDWKYLECRGGRQWLGDAPASTSFFGHHVDLPTEEAGLIEMLDEPVRRAVRKAERQGLTVEFSQTIDAMRAFYDLLCLTRRRHGVPPQPYAFFANIHRHVLAAGQGWVVLARQGPVAVAGAVFFHHGRKALFKFGASNEAFQALRANNLVMWESLQWYVRHGYVSVDFGRTSLDNEGLRRFKLGWGAKEHRLEYVRYESRTKTFVTAADASSGAHTRLFQHLPLPLSKLAGTLLYRHLG